MSVWGLSCHAKGWGHHSAGRHSPTARCVSSVTFHRVRKCRQGWAVSYRGTSPSHPPNLEGGPPLCGAAQPPKGAQPNFAMSIDGLSADVHPDFWVQQPLLSLNQQSPSERWIKACLPSRVGGRFGGRGGGEVGGALSLPLPQPEFVRPPFLAWSKMGHTPHPPKRDLHTPSPSEPRSQPQNCMESLVSNIEVERTLPFPGTKWRQVCPSSPFPALALRTPRRDRALQGLFPTSLKSR